MTSFASSAETPQARDAGLVPGRRVIRDHAFAQQRDGSGFETIFFAIGFEDLGMRLHVIDRFEPCPREVRQRFRLGLRMKSSFVE